MNRTEGFAYPGGLPQSFPMNRVSGKTVVDAKDHPSKGWYALAISIGILVIAAGGLGMMGFRQFSDLHWTLEAALGGVMLIAYAAYKIHQLRLSDLRDEQSSSPVLTALDREDVDPIPLRRLTTGSTYLDIARQYELIQVYGKEVWDGIGEIEEVPLLPDDIDDILNQQDPHQPNRRIGETYILVLIPATLDGAPLTLEKLRKCVDSTKVICYVSSEVPKRCVVETAGSQSYWALLRKDMVPRSNNKNLREQQELVKGNGGRLPSMLDLVIGHFLYFLNNGQMASTGSRIMEVRCEETVCSEDKSCRSLAFIAAQSEKIRLATQCEIIEEGPYCNIGAGRVIQLTSRGIDGDDLLIKNSL